VKAVRALNVAAAAALLAGCAAPEYKKPVVSDMPVSWKLEAPWRESTPSDSLDKGPWWLRYGDPELNALEDQAVKSSPTLQIAAARLVQARATVTATSAGLFPQLGLGGRAMRQKSSANRPLTSYTQPTFSTVQGDDVLSFNVNYEVDLAGRVSSSVANAQASAEQSAADLANTRLVLTAELAADYVNLRELDTELDVLQRSIGLQRRTLEIVTSRHDLGAGSGLEVMQQQALLDSTLTQVDVLRKQRSQFEHAIATLVGTPAPSFTLAPKVQDLTPPAVPIGIPSDVLERRPDVASAERATAAANAQIGVANAAFYPSIMLAPTLGLESRTFSTLFEASSLLWSFGISATQVLFDAGRARANLTIAKAGYDSTVANYRRVVLTAMQEVEDGVTGLAALDRAYAQSQRAVNSSRQVLDMATSRYEGGATTYLDVITAQQALLNSERQSAQLSGQRLLTSVFLVKALGGDWPGPQVASR
jgi:NodT family efflux transporter outer membrane factor (OMF) lipoprotein